MNAKGREGFLTTEHMEYTDRGRGPGSIFHHRDTESTEEGDAF